MKFSIVATLYQSAPHVEEFYQRAKRVAEKHAGDNYEIILVNDGSPDASLEIAANLSAKDKHLVVLDLSRNFGHHKAMMTGLAYATGDQVFLIDSDLEEEPEWLSKFQAVLTDEDCDVVYGVQAKRKGGFCEQFSGSLFYRLFRALTGIEQPDNIVTARLMSRRYVNALLLHKERELNIGGLWVITGFKQTPLEIKKHSTSPTTYSLGKNKPLGQRSNLFQQFATGFYVLLWTHYIHNRNCIYFFTNLEIPNSFHNTQRIHLHCVLHLAVLRTNNFLYWHSRNLHIKNFYRNQTKTLYNHSSSL